MRSASFTLFAFMVGCGCAESYQARDADVAKNNDRATDDALRRAGLGRVDVLVMPPIVHAPLQQPTIEPAPPQIGAAPGAKVLVFPASDAAPDVVRNASHVLYWLSDVKHDVKETRTGRVCGCAPGVYGAARPAYFWYVPLAPGDTYGGMTSVVARGWIDLDYTYSGAKNPGCFQVP